MESPGPADGEAATLVAAGVWALRLPAPSIYFGHSYAYLIATAKGPVLIDTGDASEPSWEVLQAGVREAGFDLADVHAILITHSHYDHCGAATRIKALSGALIAMSTMEAAFLRTHPSDYHTRAEIRALCLQAGAAEADLPDPPNHKNDGTVAAFDPDIALVDGLPLDFGDVVLRVAMTPGHSPGHAAFLMEDRGLLFAGDHLFGHGSTVVLLTDAQACDASGRLADPFGDYLRSLDRCAAIGVTLALPGHVGPFGDFTRRIEVERGRYRRRLAEIAALLDETPRAPAMLARRMRWGKGGWDDLPLAGRQLAIINTITGLRALEVTGAAVARPEGRRLRYARSAAGAPS